MTQNALLRATLPWLVIGAMLLSWANTAFYQELMAAMRSAIAEGRFAPWAAETSARLAAGERAADGSG